VGFIPLNLRSQEMDKGVPHARARAAAGRAGRGEARQASSASRVTLLLQLPTYGVTRRELTDSWHNSARAGRLLAWLGDLSPSASLCERLNRGASLSFGTREKHFQNHSSAAEWGYFHLVTLRAQRSERAGASGALAVRDLARGIGN
jgi:hypothetical protein